MQLRKPHIFINGLGADGKELVRTNGPVNQSTLKGVET